MATALNLEVLAGMGFEVPAEADAQRHGGRRPARRRRRRSTAALAGVDAALAESTPPRDRPDRGRRRRGTTGRRAAPCSRTRSRWSRCPARTPSSRRWTPLDAGLDVMVFSDNVPVEQEVALKRAAAERGLLVMGPDCGTAVVGGVGLGFANVVQPGPGRARRRLRHRRPAAAVPARPRRRRGHPRLGVGGRDLSAEVGGARHPRGAAPARRRRRRSS